MRGHIYQMTQTGDLSIINSNILIEKNAIFFFNWKIFHFQIGILLAADFLQILIEKEFNLKHDCQDT